jgi:S1-C subfamily serine protease
MVCRFRIILAAIALATLPAIGGAQTFCVVPRDSSWRPVDFGYDLEFRVRVDSGRVLDRSYPTVRRVIRGSVADSAGIRDGDVLIAVNGFDVSSRSDSARMKGPGVATRLTFSRGDSSFQRTLVGVSSPPCRTR